MEPYQAGLARGRPASIKAPLPARVVVVLDTRRENRQIALMHPFTRCVRIHDVHELISTDESSAEPGGRVDRVAGLGFITFEVSGVVMVGDDVSCSRLGSSIGTVAGFDDSHHPNHLNIIVRVPRRLTGRAIGLDLGDEIRFGGNASWVRSRDEEDRLSRP